MRALQTDVADRREHEIIPAMAYDEDLANRIRELVSYARSLPSKR